MVQAADVTTVRAFAVITCIVLKVDVPKNREARYWG